MQRATIFYTKLASHWQGCGKVAQRNVILLKKKSLDFKKKMKFLTIINYIVSLRSTSYRNYTLSNNNFLM